jgi:hypothetical protein
MSKVAAYCNRADQTFGMIQPIFFFFAAPLCILHPKEHKINEQFVMFEGNK